MVFEQILHQGYVAQGTVSLTASFDVAALYATEAGRKSEGIVFTIDTGRLTAPVSDSYATMVARCGWIPPKDFVTLTLIVTALGAKEAGDFLACCDAHARRRARITPRPTDLPPCLSPEQRSLLEAHRIETPALHRLQEAFDVFWMGALGQVMALDSDGQTVAETPVLSALYLTAFEKVKRELEAAYQRRLATGGHPGWDLTPFGYIAKTCRDREFFSTGKVPGDSLAEATVVAFAGGRGRRLRSLRL